MTRAHTTGTDKDKDKAKDKDAEMMAPRGKVRKIAGEEDEQQVGGQDDAGLTSSHGEG